ncbi:MAG: zinc ribbon domain-containing protein [Betaproteobacteria bacterium]|jgi:uncharacterized membrane protein (UPF0136 family)|nr:zinc ribbon domain-containing protein [Betaproteobacteria bacterium]NBP45555.1 zinc ribbon domain-containing protein [Betaproteobacteria bacterium]
MSQKCPYCRFSIPSDAIVCGHCGAEKRTVVTEPFDPSIVSEAGAVMGAIALALAAWFGLLSTFPWFPEHSIKGVLLGAVAGAVLGFFSPLLDKLFKAAIGLIIGVVIAAIATSIFDIKSIIPMVICGLIGLIAGFFYEKTEDQWFR